MRSTRRVAVIAVAAAVAFGLTACGGASGSSSTHSASGAGGQQAVDNKAVDNKAADDTSSSQLESWISAMEAKPSYRLTMKMGGEGAATGSVDMRDAANPRMSLSTEASGEAVKMIIVDKKLYLNMGQYTSNKYVVVDTTAGSAVAKRFAGTLDSMDIGNQTAEYKNAVKSIEKKGNPVTIDGVSAQPYEITIDTSKLTGGTVGTATVSLPPTLVSTYYVGSDNLPRRIVSSQAGTELSMDMTDWGSSMKIEAPSAAEITDANPFG